MSHGVGDHALILLNPQVNIYSGIHIFIMCDSGIHIFIMCDSDIHIFITCDSGTYVWILISAMEFVHCVKISLM